MTPAHVDIRAAQVPMRDGAQLSATLYLPEPRSAPTPCVLSLTPYVADTSHERGIYLATHGLGFVVVDVRGRGNSEGTFRPFIQEARDGYDAIEWLAAEAFCNGDVGMCGGSYLGYAQWATAKEFPPHLKTIVPTAAPCLGVDFPMRNNIFYPYLARWLCLTRGRTLQIKSFSDASLWSQTYRRWHESGAAFQALDQAAHQPCATFQEWIINPEQGPYWDAYNPTPQNYADLSLPILTLTGSYDDDQAGALEHYRQHTAHASPEAAARHYLVIGPWDHAATSTGASEFGGLQFGSASQIDLPKLHRDWYAWTLEGGPKPEFLEKRVAYYVMAADRWQYADTLEDATAKHTPLHLASGGSANDMFLSGSLLPAISHGPPDQFTYDPRDLHGAEVSAEAQADASSITDQTLVFALSGRLLVYHSAPFAEDTEITGFFKLTAWIAIDCPDTDLYASVYEITAEGISIRLSSDALRARYRADLRTPRLIDTKEPQRYEFSRFTFVSRRIARTHRLRLVISPVGRLIDSTFTQKNYNNGGIIADETVASARPVTVRLFHDAARPGTLYMPIGTP
jgi:uncharacterized protein